MNKKMIGDLLKQAQDMQDRIQKAQEEASQKVIEVASGGNMVSVQMNGRQELLAITIDPEIVKAGDVAMLQDLIIAAVNEAVRRSQEFMAEEMKGLTGGGEISMPSFMKGLF